MATPTRRAIGADPAGAQATATSKPKAEDVVVDPAAEPAPAPATEPAKDEIVPVDTESADYKAGYQNALDGVDCESNDYRQGYAAGLGAKGEAPADAPAEPAPAAARAAGKPATVQELKALAPDDDAFVVAQLQSGATLAAAQSARLRALDARLKAETAARLKAERDLAAEQKSPPPLRTAKGTTPAAAAAADPDAEAKADWAANVDNCQADFVSEQVYVGYRRRQR